jgi:hypothetical protein
MPSGNLDEPVTTTSPHAAPPRSFRLPADYYSSPPSDVRPLFPKWVPLGCGTAAAVLLVILFAAGALMTGPRLALLMDFVVGSSLGELKGMYAPDVTPQQKAAFDAEVKQLRDGLRNHKVSLQNFQPFLKQMQTVIADKKVTAEEVTRLTKIAHDAALQGKKTTPRVEEPPPRDHDPLAH